MNTQELELLIAMTFYDVETGNVPKSKAIMELAYAIENNLSIPKTVEKKPEPIKVGTLIKAFGEKGYDVAQIGHDVFELGDKYLIFITKTGTVATKTVSFYKESLKPIICFSIQTN